MVAESGLTLASVKNKLIDTVRVDVTVVVFFSQTIVVIFSWFALVARIAGILLDESLAAFATEIRCEIVTKRKRVTIVINASA